MKFTKKIIALFLVLGTLASFCICAGASTTRSYAIKTSVSGGYVTASFIVKNAAGLKTCGRKVTYDTRVLQLEGTPTDGPYKNQYTKCGESVLTMYNTKTAGTIVPGIVFREMLYTDAKFSKLVKEKKQTFTPVKTSGVVLFTVKFKIKSGVVTKTTIKWGSTSKKITIRLSDAVKLTSVKNVSSGVQVKWKKQTSATSYMVYRKTAGAKKWTKVGSTKATSFIDKSAKAGKKYTYTVRSVYHGLASPSYSTTGLTIKRK